MPAEAFSQESPPSSEEPVQARPESISEAYDRYLGRLNELPTAEEKIAHGLVFMKEAISQEGTPRFREFWEARRHLLPLFKQNLNLSIRSKLWNEYVDLTVEARRLKDILEEQSAFAVEQIDLAITAIEQDIANTNPATASPIPFPQEARFLADKFETYNKIQSELNGCNAAAGRLNSFRKEIIKTEMRIRFKTKFFKRLSELGDRVFPKRKELIEAVSSEFDRDIQRFIETHFQGEEVVGAPYYALREEIKAMQSMAKQLTLNTSVFTKTRLGLSECWDKIRVLEKAHKQEFQQKKQAWTENRESIAKKLDELKEKISEMDLKQVDAVLEEISKDMRAVELGKDDVRLLRQEIAQIRAPFVEQLEKKRKEAEEAELEKAAQKKNKIASVKERISVLQKDAEKTGEQLLSELEEIRRDIEGFSLGKFEQQQFDRLLRPIKDLIAERKEGALLSLSEDQRMALDQLREVLAQRKSRRQEIKEQIETYRKALSGSGLDFEKAMLYREQMDLEKERLEKANSSIAEIEQKISEIEDNA